MISQVFAYVTSWFFSFFTLYGWLSVPLGIATYSGIALALWSIVRFVLIPLFGSISFVDSDGDMLSETVTETVSTSDPKQHLGGGVYRRRTVTHTKSRTSRRREK